MDVHKGATSSFAPVENENQLVAPSGIIVPPDWHVLYTMPRAEKKVVDLLERRGYEVYCPMRKEMRQWADRKKLVWTPFFPSYAFLRIKEFWNQRVEILELPHVLNFMYWEKQPALIKDEEMAGIRTFIQRYGGQHIETEKIKEGEEVKLGQGPFNGFVGTVKRISGNKVYLMVPSLHYQLVVTLPTISRHRPIVAK
jgi:transcription antitermination factor NusG